MWRSFLIRAVAPASVAVIFAVWVVLAFAPLLRAQDATPVITPPPPVTAKVLRVYTKPLEPFVMGTGGELKGFSIELWAALAQRMGVRYEWHEVKTVQELLNAAQTGGADVALAGISMTPEREAKVDFTHPYFNAGLQIMTATGGDIAFTSVLGLLTSPALLQILFIGLVILVIMAHVVWLVERKFNPDMPMAYWPGIWEALYLALGTLASAEYGGRSSRVIWRRLLSMFWVFLSIILIAQFTASVTSLLTVQQLQGDIRGVSDLPGKRVATVQNTTASRYLDANNINYVGVPKIEDAYKLLNSKQADAVVFDAPVLLYYALTEGKGRAQTVGRIFQPETYGIALPPGSPLRKPINEALLELQHDGTYDAIYSRWFGSLD